MVAAGARSRWLSPGVLSPNRSLASITELEGRTVGRTYELSGGRGVLSWLSLADFAECRGREGDAEPMSDLFAPLRGVRDCHAAAEQDGEVRGSFRSKDDTDVAAIAGEFGGGRT